MTSSAEDLRETEAKISTMCICRGCPTYVALGVEDDYVGYCFVGHGRSKKITSEEGCICGTCPVYEMNQYMTNYYCTRGIEKEQKEAIAQEIQTGTDAIKTLKKLA